MVTNNLMPNQSYFGVFGAGADEGLSAKGNSVEAFVRLDKRDIKSEHSRDASSSNI